MYMHASNKKASNYEVMDLDIGKPIRGVQWANDENGKYEVAVFSEKGYPDVVFDKEKEEFRTEIKIGNIKIVKKSEVEND
ncbi:hypothetical protein LCGC14_1181080 [marine sediment metagenome]|uniref:Uncharacterized protein n=1 Tax=marine sediment metagenome TaxID=412755 RepID=A0A0F9LRY1_9ZZZZ